MSDKSPEAEDPRRPTVLEYGRPAPKKPKSDGYKSLLAALCAWAGLAAGMLLPAMGPEPVPLAFWLIMSLAAIVWGRAELKRPPPFDFGSRTRAYAGLSLALLSFVALVAAYLLTPQLGTPRRLVDPHRCASNMRQVGQGIQFHVDEYGGAFPTQLEVLFITEDVNPEVLTCPHTEDIKATGNFIEQVMGDFLTNDRCSYIYLGAGLTKDTVPPEMILLHEKPGNHDKDGMNIVFGDCHVEWIEQAEAERILAELKLGHNPPRAKDGGGR